MESLDSPDQDLTAGVQDGSGPDGHTPENNPAPEDELKQTTTSEQREKAKKDNLRTERITEKARKFLGERGIGYKSLK